MSVSGNGLSVWQLVELARHPDRPYAIDYIRRSQEAFVRDLPELMQLKSRKRVGNELFLVYRVSKRPR